MSFEPDKGLLIPVTSSNDGVPRSELPTSWSVSLMDDYTLKGAGGRDVADKANDAANGAYVAQTWATINEQSINALSTRVTVTEAQIANLQDSTLDNNPYGTLLRDASAIINLVDGVATDADYTGTIAGRRVTLGATRITIIEGGVYRLDSDVEMTAGTAFTLEVIAGGVIWFTRTGTDISKHFPVIDIPLISGDEVFINLVQNGTPAGFDVTQNWNYLTVSRQGR